MKKNIITILILAIFALGGGAFYGGMKYERNKSQNNSEYREREGEAPTTPKLGVIGGGDASPYNRQQRFQQFGQSGMRDSRNIRNRQGMEFTLGEILSKDDKSITVKLRDGGSKIVFLSQSTQITETSAATPKDLTTGEQVSINGKANADGSITAEIIQIRPPMPPNRMPESVIPSS